MVFVVPPQQSDIHSGMIIGAVVGCTQQTLQQLLHKGALKHLYSSRSGHHALMGSERIEGFPNFGKKYSFPNMTEFFYTLVCPSEQQWSRKLDELLIEVG